jgi:hypothetical protein
MPWNIQERKLGRAGDPRQRAARQREWDRKYGPDNWEIGFVLDGEFVRQDTAFQSVYCAGYAAHFERQPEVLTQMTSATKTTQQQISQRADTHHSQSRHLTILATPQ